MTPPSPPSPPARATTACRHLMAALMLAVIAAGCSVSPFVETHSQLAVASRTYPGTHLLGEFDRAVYRLDGENAATIVLIDGTIEHPVQAAAIRLFWKPQAGQTPISPAATNATVQYMVFADDVDATTHQAEESVEAAGGEVGVYSGAGYVFPNSKLGQGTLRAGLWQATLRLADRSRGFDDLLGKARVHGRIVAHRNDAAVNDLLRRLSVRVSERLGYPRLVHVPPAADRRVAASQVSDG